MAETKKPIYLSEAYPAVRGGGYFSGSPVLVIRLFGVDFMNKNDCHKQAWGKGVQKRDIELNRTLLTSEELLSKIKKFKQGNLFKWFITGGEALKQQDQLVDFITTFKEAHGKAPEIEIKTAGHISVIPELDKYVTKYLVSVPTSNSMDGIARETFAHRIKENVLKEFITNPKAEFLFEMKTDNDIKEIQEISEMFRISKDRIWLSPIETRVGAIRVNQTLVWGACLNFGYKYYNRLSLQVFGPNKKNI